MFQADGDALDCVGHLKVRFAQPRVVRGDLDGAGTVRVGGIWLLQASFAILAYSLPDVPFGIYGSPLRDYQVVVRRSEARWGSQSREALGAKIAWLGAVRKAEDVMERIGVRHQGKGV